MDTSDKGEVAVAEGATRRLRTLEEKLAILAEAARPGASVAAVARKHDVNANLVFGWRRLHRRGLLEDQRHAPPLLPVTITTPTVTPTRRASAVALKRDRMPARLAPVATEPRIEVIVGADIRIRLRGEAQEALLTRLLEWLPRR